MKSKNDGIFHIDMENFMKYFRDIQVCFFHDNFKYCSIPIQSKNIEEEIFVTFNATKEGICYLSLNQVNARHFSPEHNYKYSNLKILLFRQDDIKK